MCRGTMRLSCVFLNKRWLSHPTRDNLHTKEIKAQLLRLQQHCVVPQPPHAPPSQRLSSFPTRLAASFSNIRGSWAAGTRTTFKLKGGNRGITFQFRIFED